MLRVESPRSSFTRRGLPDRTVCITYTRLIAASFTRWLTPHLYMCSPEPSWDCVQGSWLWLHLWSFILAPSRYRQYRGATFMSMTMLISQWFIDDWGCRRWQLRGHVSHTRQFELLSVKDPVLPSSCPWHVSSSFVIRLLKFCVVKLDLAYGDWRILFSVAAPRNLTSLLWFLPMPIVRILHWTLYLLCFQRLCVNVTHTQKSNVNTPASTKLFDTLHTCLRPYPHIPESLGILWEDQLTVHTGSSASTHHFLYWG